MSYDDLSLKKDQENGAGRVHATLVEEDMLAGTGNVPLKYMGTNADKRDMSTLGREQVLRVRTHCRIPASSTPTDAQQRNFRFISILGFGCTLICTWEVILT